MNARITDYLAFSVPNIWVIDPMRRRLWIYSRHSSMQEATGSVKLPGRDIEVPFSDIFD